MGEGRGGERFIQAPAESLQGKKGRKEVGLWVGPLHVPRLTITVRMNITGMEKIEDIRKIHYVISNLITY